MAQIRELENIDRATIGLDQLSARLKRLFDGYSCFTRTVESKLAWRSRRLDSATPYDHVSELWYPPAHKQTAYGRLNRPGQSIMYLSASHHTALLEMRPEVGERFAILQLRLRNEAEMPHVMELGVVEKAFQHGLPSRVHLLDQTNVGNDFLKGNQRKNLAIRSFLVQELTRVVPRGKEDVFKITAEIAQILMHSQKIDGVEYPSMAGDVDRYGGAVNLALKPSSADRLYIADACWLSQIEGRTEAGFRVRCTKRARFIADSGEIAW